MPKPKHILKETSTPAKGKVVRLQETAGLGGESRLRVRGVCQAINRVNENNRRYGSSIWEKHLSESSHFMNEMRAGRVLGELEHPESGQTHLRRVSHVVNNAWVETLGEDNEYEVEPGDWVIGESTILNTPDGKILQEIIDATGQAFVSSRGRGNTTPGSDGVDEVCDDYDLTTWDFVSDPSVRQAAQRPIHEVKAADARKVIDEIKDATHIQSDAEVKTLLERTTQPKQPQQETACKGKSKKGKKPVKTEKSITTKKATVERVMSHLVKENASLRTKLNEKGSTKMNEVTKTLLMKAKTLVDENKGLKKETVTLQEKYEASVTLVEEMAKAIEEIGPTKGVRNRQGDRSRRTRKPGFGKRSGRGTMRGESRTRRPLKEDRRPRRKTLKESNDGRTSRRPRRERPLRERREITRMKPVKENDPAGKLIEKKVDKKQVAPSNLIEACVQKGM